jgi:glycosyltransferase involved in cell wall biosynthesis
MSVTISCIIPTYNRPEVICETIQQLLAQSTPAHEIIVIDQTKGYSSEITARLQAFARSGAIQWYCQLYPNASMARNSGAVLASGNVLLFLDDDILIGPGFLGAHARNYTDAKVQGVAGQILDGNGSIVDVLKENDGDVEWASLNFPKNYGHRMPTAWMASGNFSVKRAIYLELGGMDEWYEKGANREESDFAFRFHRSGRLFMFDPAATIYHLGQQLVRGGGCRSYTGSLGAWHHFVGMWYFTVGFARPSNIFPMIWCHYRTLVLNRATLVSPTHFILKNGMFVSAAMVALSRRWRGPRLLTVS